MENLLLPAPASCTCFLPSAYCLLLTAYCLLPRGPSVKELTLHLPAPNIEPPACATVQARPVGLPLAGEGPTHFFVPTAKQPRHPVADPAPRRNVLQYV